MSPSIGDDSVYCIVAVCVMAGLRADRAEDLATPPAGVY